MIIHDLDGREYKIYNIEEFKNHIKTVSYCRWEARWKLT